jgi:hypothetical protein
MGYKLTVINPSDYARGGHIATPWQPIEKATGIPSDNLRVLHEGIPLPAQVDRIDPSDPCLDTLAFVLDKKLASGLSDYSWSSEHVSLESGEPQTGSPPSTDSREQPVRIELANSKLLLSLSLTPSQAPEDAACFAGAVQSFRILGDAARRVGLDEVEMLDAWQSISRGLFDHDPEKRCMQVDRLFIPNASWSARLAEEVKLYKLPYQLLSSCTGPVRQSRTLVSEPFDYACPDPFLKRDVTMSCRFYRSMILYHDADYVMEELWLKGKTPQHEEEFDLGFSANYFAQMEMERKPEIHWRDYVPDWFAIGYPFGFVRPGYGFATDVHSRQPRWPSPEYPLTGRAYRTFSWELHPCRKARCVHLFQINDPEPIEHRIGHAWYEEIYKPLRARI